MKIAIVGPGAMGCLFGAFFARAGNEVWLLDHDEERAAQLQMQGVRLLEEGEESLVAVHATTRPETIGPCELVLVLVKAPQTSNVCSRIPPLLGAVTPVLTLQNGLGGADLLAQQLEPERILAGTTAQGATLLGPGHVRHGGNGETLIGPHLSGGTAHQEIVDLFCDAGLAARWVDDPKPALWKKLAANCGINAITALTSIRNGVIPRSDAATRLCAEAVRETVRVARACGVELGDEDSVVGWVLEVATATGANRSSMGQDVDRKQPTEINFLNGAVVREGERQQIATPVNRILTQLVHTVEAGFTADGQGKGQGDRP